MYINFWIKVKKNFTDKSLNQDYEDYYKLLKQVYWADYLTCTQVYAVLVDSKIAKSQLKIKILKKCIKY